jgi:hypothetical protein
MSSERSASGFVVLELAFAPLQARRVTLSLHSEGPGDAAAPHSLARASCSRAFTVVAGLRGGLPPVPAAAFAQALGALRAELPQASQALTRAAACTAGARADLTALTSTLAACGLAVARSLIVPASSRLRAAALGLLAAGLEHLRPGDVLAGVKAELRSPGDFARLFQAALVAHGESTADDEAAAVAVAALARRLVAAAADASSQRFLDDLLVGLLWSVRAVARLSGPSAGAGAWLAPPRGRSASMSSEVKDGKTCPSLIIVPCSSRLWTSKVRLGSKVPPSSAAASVWLSEQRGRHGRATPRPSVAQHG